MCEQREADEGSHKEWDKQKAITEALKGDASHFIEGLYSMPEYTQYSHSHTASLKTMGPDKHIFSLLTLQKSANKWKWGLD